MWTAVTGLQRATPPPDYSVMRLAEVRLENRQVNLLVTIKVVWR